MALLNFRKKTADTATASANPAQMEAFLQGYSIEVMPRTASKVEDFREILPAGTRVYIAHIEGTPIEEMVETAARINAEGFDVMPHFPARIIHDEAMLANWIAMYQGEANVKQALLLAGGVDKPHGAFHSSMQLLESGLFDKAGFTRLHVAGHPEGNKDIDKDGSHKNVEEALQWKQKFSERTDAIMAAQAKLEEQIKISLGESKDLVNSLPAQTAKSVEGISKNIAAQVVAMDAQMKKQASAMASLGGQVKSLAGSVGDVAPLKRDVQALVTLQRQRYLEALQQQQQRSSTGSAAEVIVQFPNPKAVKTPEKATQ